jgi:hypothetical protein
LQYQPALDPTLFGEVLQVSYNTDFPRLRYFEMTPEEYGRVVVLSKDKAWEYEQEWRLLRIDEPPGLRPHRPEAMTGIVLGAAMDAALREEVLQWIKDAGRTIDVRQAVVRPGSYSLDLIPGSG